MNGRAWFGAWVLLISNTPTWAAASEAPVLPAADLPGMLQALVALVVLLLVILALPWLMRRLSGLGPNLDGRMRVLTALAVGPRERIVLVQVGNEQLLLGVAPGQVRLLHVLPEPVPPTSGSQPDPISFSQRLNSAMAKLRNTQ